MRDLLRNGLCVQEIQTFFRRLSWMARRNIMFEHPQERADTVHLRQRPSDLQLATATASEGGTTRSAPVRLEDMELLTCICRCAVHPTLVGGGDGVDGANQASATALRAFVSRLIGDNHAGITFETVVARVQEDARGREMGLMLALELQRQLGVLSVNAHPFYTPSSFSSSAEYGTWRQREITWLREVMEGLWPEPLPEAHHDDYSGRHLHHASFGRLVQLCRSTDRALHGAAAERGLSPEATVLLDEYGTQFGVGHLFRTLVMLQSLTLDPTPYCSWWYIRVRAHLERLQACLDDNPAVVPCLAELALARQCCSSIHDHVRTVLTNLTEVVPRQQPLLTLRFLLEMLPSLVRLDKVLGLTSTGHTPAADPEALVLALMRESAAASYQAIVRLHAAAAPVDGASGPRSPPGAGRNSVGSPASDPGGGTGSPCSVRQLVHVVQTMEDRLLTLGRTFRAPLGRIVDVLEVHAVAMFDLLFRDVRGACTTYLAREQGQEVDADLFSLAFRLQGLTSRWEGVVGAGAANQWKPQFVPVVMRWIDALKTKAEGWVTQARQQDDWSPIWIGGEETMEASLGVGGSIIDLLLTVTRFARFSATLFEVVQPHATSDADAGPSAAGGDANLPYDPRLHCATHLVSVLQACWREFVYKVAIIGDEVLADTAFATLQHPVLGGNEPAEGSTSSTRFNSSGIDVFSGSSDHERPAGRPIADGGRDPAGNPVTPRSAARPVSRSSRLSSESRGHRFRLTSESVPGTPSEASFVLRLAADGPESHVGESGYSSSSLEPRSSTARRRHSGAGGVSRALKSVPSPQFASTPTRPGRAPPAASVSRHQPAGGQRSRRMSSDVPPPPASSAAGRRSRRNSIMDLLGPVPAPPVMPTRSFAPVPELDGPTEAFCTRANTIYCCMHMFPELGQALERLISGGGGSFPPSSSSATGQGANSMMASMEGVLVAHVKTFVGRVLLRSTRTVQRVFEEPKLGEPAPPPMEDLVSAVTAYMNTRLIGLANALHTEVFTLVLDQFWR